MTLWERVEDLARRVRELEAGRRQSTEDILDFHNRLNALEARVPKPVALQPGGPDCPAHDTRCSDGDCVLSRPGYQSGGQRMPIGALEAIGGDGSCEGCGARPGDEHIGNCPKYIEALQRDMHTPPPSCEARLLGEACGFLSEWAESFPEYAFADETKAFLARARVALEKP